MKETRKKILTSHLSYYSFTSGSLTPYFFILSLSIFPYWFNIFLFISFLNHPNPPPRPLYICHQLISLSVFTCCVFLCGWFGRVWRFSLAECHSLLSAAIATAPGAQILRFKTNSTLCWCIRPKMSADNISLPLIETADPSVPQREPNRPADCNKILLIKHEGVCVYGGFIVVGSG